MRRLRSWILAILWLLTLATAFLAGAYAYRSRTKIRAFLGRRQPAEIVGTHLYNLRFETLVTPTTGRYGAIEALDDGILLADGQATLWFIGHDRNPVQLATRIPLNVEEFNADPYNEQTDRRDNFAVKDIIVLPSGNAGIRLVASFNHWKPAEDCYTVRVAVLETTWQELRSTSTPAGEWRPLYDTHPCRELGVSPSGRRGPSIGAGGRLVQLSPDEVLFSVGGLSPETSTESIIRIQDSGNSYGKTIAINLVSGDSRVYTIGHRNPQGLARGRDGRIWLAEHGPRGGDELNLLEEGGNYGWPVVSYGTEYGQMIWPGNPRQGRHDGYLQPMFAWVPAIGASQVMVLEGDRFPYWAGDVFVSTLSAQTLFRVRVEDGRVIFVEPIPIQHRIRDVAEAADGAIVVKGDDDVLVYITPVEAADTAGLDPVSRGAVLAAQCKGCHDLEPTRQTRIGPPLFGIVGRRIAAHEGFAYSPALLSRASDRWTPEALGAYIAAPDSFAPGTSMVVPTPYSDEEIAALLAYLESLK